MNLQEPALLREACYIGGKWITSGDTIRVTNPADGSLVGTVPRLGSAEAGQAIAAAKGAWAGWRDRTPVERGAVMHKWYDLICKHVEDLAVIMTAEQGKPLAESRAEILSGASYVRWYAEECRRCHGEFIVAPTRGRQPLTMWQSIGVVAAITPWNFPASMGTRKASPALAAGCPVILKPASATPFSLLAMAELAHQAGFPAGVFNVVTGNAGEIASALTKSRDVRALSFTGSTAVGKELLAACAGTVKKTAMELGGNAPFLVFDDAHLESTLSGFMACKFRNAGQTCICANRVLVQDNIYDAFLSGLQKKVAALHVGSGFEEDVNIGPLINEQAMLNMDEFVADAVGKGATLVCGGKRHAKSGGGGNFFEPTILTGVTPEMRVFREEIFGPIAALTRFSTEEEGIALANDSEFGLASYLYSRDIGRVMRVAARLESGMVGANEAMLSTCEVPFGGVKESGLGREGARTGLEEFMELKYIVLGGLDL